jgi:hypothetical protein
MGSEIIKCDVELPRTTKPENQFILSPNCLKTKKNIYSEVFNLI